MTSCILRTRATFCWSAMARGEGRGTAERGRGRGAQGIRKVQMKTRSARDGLVTSASCSGSVRGTRRTGEYHVIPVLLAAVHELGA